MTYTTDPKELNKKESPSKDAWIILGREDKLVIGRRGEVRGGHHEAGHEEESTRKFSMRTDSNNKVSQGETKCK